MTIKQESKALLEEIRKKILEIDERLKKKSST